MTNNFYINIKIKLEDYKKIFLCNYPGCNFFLDNPITLTCCQSVICQTHTSNKSNDGQYKCCLCNETVKIPDQGFIFNSSLSRLIDCHLTDHQKILISKLKLSKLAREQFASIDIENFVDCSFQSLKNDTDLHKTNQIKLMNDKIDIFFAYFNNLETELLNHIQCSKLPINIGNLMSDPFSDFKKRLKLAQSESIHEINQRSNDIIEQILIMREETIPHVEILNEKKISLNSKFESQINDLQIKLIQTFDDKELKYLERELDILFLTINNEKRQLEKEALMINYIYFEPKENNLFGELKIKI
jgi:hypothetical protein